MTLRELFCDRNFNNKLVTLAVPMTLQSLMVALVAAADALMLGKLDQDAMAAVSLATQIQFVQAMLLYSVVSGINILGAQYWGKGDIPVMGRIFGLGVRDATLMSLLFFAGCRFFPEPLMRLFAHDPVLLDYGVKYLKIASWSYLLVGVSQAYLAMMRVSDHAASSAWISSIAVVLNIILNALMIFGYCGFPAMGVEGAASATVASRVIELLLCVIISLRKDYIRLRVRSVFEFDRLLICDFWRCALPIMASCALWGVGFTAYTAIMGHMGRDAAAANSIAAVVRDLMCCLCNGLAGGCAVLIGNELGAGNLELGKKYGQRSAILSFVVGFVIMVLILLSIPLTSNLVKLTSQAQTYLNGMFVILAVYMVGRCVCTVVINAVFSSGGDTMFDMYSLIVCMWAIALPCALLGAFYFKLPVLAVYACTCLDEVGKVPWVMHHYKKYKWVRNLTRD